MKKKPSTIKLYFYGLSFSPSIFQPESFFCLGLTIAPGIVRNIILVIFVHAFSVKSILCIVNNMMISDIRNRTSDSGILLEAGLSAHE